MASDLEAKLEELEALKGSSSGWRTRSQRFVPARVGEPRAITRLTTRRPASYLAVWEPSSVCCLTCSAPRLREKARLS